jgi:hypothetical protein
MIFCQVVALGAATLHSVRLCAAPTIGHARRQLHSRPAVITPCRLAFVTPAHATTTRRPTRLPRPFPADKPDLVCLTPRRQLKSSHDVTTNPARREPPMPDQPTHTMPSQAASSRPLKPSRTGSTSHPIAAPCLSDKPSPGSPQATSCRASQTGHPFPRRIPPTSHPTAVPASPTSLDPAKPSRFKPTSQVSSSRNDKPSPPCPARSTFAGPTTQPMPSQAAPTCPVFLIPSRHASSRTDEPSLLRTVRQAQPRSPRPTLP